MIYRTKGLFYRWEKIDFTHEILIIENVKMIYKVNDYANALDLFHPLIFYFSIPDITMMKLYNTVPFSEMGYNETESEGLS